MKNNTKIFLLALICFFLGSSEFIIVGVLDKIALSTHISITQAGQLLSVFAITASIGTPVIMYFIGAYNQRRNLSLALLVIMLASFLMAVAPTYPLLLLARILMALGVGVFNVICFIVAAKLADPEKRSQAIATVTVGFNAALIIGLPIGRVITGLWGWRTIFYGAAFFCLVAFGLVVKYIPPFEGDKPLPLTRQFRILNNSRIIINLMVSFFWITGYSLLYSYITPFIQTEIHTSEKQLSFILLFFGISTLAGNKVGGYLGDKIGSSKTIVISLVVHVLSLICLSLFKGLYFPTIIFLIIWAVAAWIPGPLFRFSIIDLCPETPSVILSLYNSIIQLGLAVGPFLGGMEVHFFSVKSLSWTAASVVFVSLCLILLLSISGNSRSFSKIDSIENLS